MFDSGEELLAGSLRAPWLIWIHLFVLLILLLLLSSLALLASDLAGADASGGGAAASAASTAAALFASKPPLRTGAAANFPTRLNGDRREVVEERKNGRNLTSSTNRIAREESLEREDSVSISSQITFLEEIYNPCHYFKLAREAFLKCLGLDFTSEDSSPTNRTE